MESSLDDLHRAWRTDPTELTPLLEAITDRALRVASGYDSRLATEDAKDIFQEVTLAIWSTLTSGNVDSLVGLVTIATVNRVRDRQRGRDVRVLDGTEPDDPWRSTRVAAAGDSLDGLSPSGCYWVRHRLALASPELTPASMEQPRLLQASGGELGECRIDRLVLFEQRIVCARRHALQLRCWNSRVHVFACAWKRRRVLLPDQDKGRHADSRQHICRIPMEHR